MRGGKVSRNRRNGSILDLFLIFLFLLCILGLLLRWHELKGEESNLSLSAYTLTARMSGVSPQTVDCVEEGDALYTATGELFGYVSRVIADPAEVTLIADGEAWSGAWDSSILNDLTVEIEVMGVWREEILLHDGRKPLAVGQSLSLRSETVAFLLKLYKMTPKEL